MKHACEAHDRRPASFDASPGVSERLSSAFFICLLHLTRFEASGDRSIPPACSAMSIPSTVNGLPKASFLSEIAPSPNKARTSLGKNMCRCAGHTRDKTGEAIPGEAFHSAFGLCLPVRGKEVIYEPACSMDAPRYKQVCNRAQVYLNTGSFKSLLAIAAISSPILSQ